MSDIEFREPEPSKASRLSLLGDLTPEAEAAILAKVRAEFDPFAAEAEFKELFRQYEAGQFVSGDEVLAMVKELVSTYERQSKEPK